MSQFPVPQNYRDTLDRFSFVLLGAPEFKRTPVKYTFTLDDVMASLDAGVAGVASRIKNSEALALFDKCREEIKVTHQYFKEGKLSEARRQIQVARDFFKQAAKLRSTKQSKALVEDDGQP